MKQIRFHFKDVVIYGLVAAMSVGAAFLISFRFLGRLRAQQGGPPATAPGQAAEAPGSPAKTAGGAPAAGGATAPGGTKPVEPEMDTDAKANSAISELEGFLEPFIYDSVNRRDPFVPFSEFADSSVPSRPLSPAQRFDLDQLKLVGVMWDIRDPKAMFMDPEAEVLVLGRDEGIGNRNGYIASIREGEVVVVEAIRKRGDIVYKTRVLRIER